MWWWLCGDCCFTLTCAGGGCSEEEETLHKSEKCVMYLLMLILYLMYTFYTYSISDNQPATADQDKILRYIVSHTHVVM